MILFDLNTLIQPEISMQFTNKLIVHLYQLSVIYIYFKNKNTNKRINSTAGMDIVGPTLNIVFHGLNEIIAIIFGDDNEM